MIPARPLLALTVLVGASCTPSSPDSAPLSGAPAEETETSTPPGAPPARPGVPLADLLAPGADARALLARLDPPRRTNVEAVANRHVPGQVDTVRTLFYDGLRLEVYEVSGSGAFVQEVEVTGPGYTTAEGVGLGTSRDAVEAAYGPALHTEGDATTYQIGTGADDPAPTMLTVRFKGNVVAALEWALYVD